MLLHVGSYAAGQRGLFLGREPRDRDVIATLDDTQKWMRRNSASILSALPVEKGKKYVIRSKAGEVWEFELAWEGSAARKLIELVKDDPDTWRMDDDALMPSLDVLYALKLSHRYLKDSPHFLKTMDDIWRLRAAGSEVPERYRDWLKQREKETYWYKHPKLNVAKADFFTGDGVKYVYDHDSIHEAMKHLERPAYTYFLKGAVACDKDRFFAAPKVTQLYSVLEEAYVLAVERSQVPYKDKPPTPDWSFFKALMKVCSSITSGWWREFAWEHYDEVVELYEQDRPPYVQKFWNAVQSGIVLPYTGTRY